MNDAHEGSLDARCPHDVTVSITRDGCKDCTIADLTAERDEAVNMLATVTSIRDVIEAERDRYRAALEAAAYRHDDSEIRAMFPWGVAACNDACSRGVPPSDQFIDEWDGTEWFWAGNHEGADDALAASNGDPEGAEVRMVMAGIHYEGPIGEEGPWLAVGEGHFRFWEVSWT